jgi:phage terminase small subunit
MPALKNPRHERFAQFLAGGKSATDAYEEAGYKRSHSNGPALARTEEISARVAQINTENLERERAAATTAAERAAVTRHSLVEEAKTVLAAAKEAKQHSAAVSALKELGILAGVRIERSERGAPGEFAELECMTAAELRAYIAKALAELRAEGSIDEPPPSDARH